MENSPITDKSVGIAHDWSADKFRDVRVKAKDERDDIVKHRSKRNKKEKIPKFDIDQEVVIVHEGWKKGRHYHLVKVVDFSGRRHGFEYYAILLKTTDKRSLDRVGRLTTFSEERHIFGSWIPANVTAEGMKWVDENVKR